jgi:hypothetical protein
MDEHVIELVILALSALLIFAGVQFAGWRERELQRREDRRGFAVSVKR